MSTDLLDELDKLAEKARAEDNPMSDVYGIQTDRRAFETAVARAWPQLRDELNRLRVQAAVQGEAVNKRDDELGVQDAEIICLQAERDQYKWGFEQEKASAEKLCRERDQLAARLNELQVGFDTLLAERGHLSKRLEKAEAVCEAVSNWDPWGNLEISERFEAWRRAKER